MPQRPDLYAEVQPLFQEAMGIRRNGAVALQGDAGSVALSDNYQLDLQFDYRLIAINILSTYHVIFV